MCFSKGCYVGAVVCLSACTLAGTRLALMYTIVSIKWATCHLEKKLTPKQSSQAGTYYRYVTCQSVTDCYFLVCGYNQPTLKIIVYVYILTFCCYHLGLQPILIGYILKKTMLKTQCIHQNQVTKGIFLNAFNKGIISVTQDNLSMLSLPRLSLQHACFTSPKHTFHSFYLCLQENTKC